MSRLADCEKQLVEAHQWGQKMRDERDALRARVEVLENACRRALEDGEFSIYSDTPEILRAALSGQEDARDK